MPDYPAFPNTIFHNETDGAPRTELGKLKLEAWATQIRDYIDAAVAAGGGGGGSGGFWLPASIMGYLTTATSAQNRINLQNAINVLPAAGGTIVIEAGDFLNDISTPLDIGSKNVKIIGAGKHATRLIADNENNSTSMKFFRMLGSGTLELSDLTVIGPVTIGAGGRFDVIYADSVSGNMRVNQCRFDNFTSVLRVSSAGNWLGNIEAFHCIFDGYGGSGVQSSTPILTNSQGTGARGRGVRCYFCEFLNIGDSASGLHHGLYIASDWDIDVAFNRFISSVGTGYALQIFDGNVTNNSESYSQRFIGNHIGLTWGARGVVCGGRARLNITNNFFGNNNTWINFNGGSANVINNNFVGGGTGTIDGIITTGSPATTMEPVVIKNNKFIAFVSRFIDISQFGDYEISGNVYRGFSPCLYCISVNNSGANVRVDGDSYLGGANQAQVRVAAGNLTVAGCHFRSTGPGHCINVDSTAAQLRVNGTEFSQVSGNSVQQNSVPSVYQSRANYGSIGLSDNPAVGGGGSTTETIDAGTVTNALAGADVTLDMATHTDVLWLVKLGSNGVKLDIMNWSPGKSVTLELSQDATGGRTGVTLPTVTWSGAVAPILTTNPDAVDILSFYSNGVKVRGFADLDHR